MKVLKAQRTLAVPEGVEVTLKARKISVTGPRGTLKRDFTYLPRIDVSYDKEAGLITTHSVYRCHHVVPAFHFCARQPPLLGLLPEPE
jgi:large subunit ribosomal protein L9e